MTPAVINKSTIDLVRQRTDLVALIGETVKLQRAGRSWKGLCPFHKEKSPSFHVTPERGMFHCFGCQEHGSGIDFVMKVEGLSFPEAVRRLAERAGVEVEETATESERKQEAAQRKTRDDLFAAMQVAAVFYETCLREHPDAHVARAELERRGLVPEGPTDAIATALSAFRVGYAPAQWDALAQYFRTHGVNPIVAEQVGLISPRNTGGGHYDRFRSRLMFGVVDLQGRVVAFSGRILADPKTGQVEKDVGKYYNSPETPIFRKGDTVFGLFQARQAIRQAEEAVVVEGNFDVVSLHARGIANVVAPLGTAFTPEQAQLLKRFAPTVTLLFDGDAAGKKAARAAREPCKRAGLEAKAAIVPPGTDPDDLVRTKGPDAVRAVIRAARGLLEHLITSALDDSFVRADAGERVQRLKEVIELLRSEEDPTVRAMAQKYADDVAGRLAMADTATGQVDARTFAALARQVQAAVLRPADPQENDRPVAPLVRRDPVVEAFLGCLFDFPPLLDDPEIEPFLHFLRGDAVFVVQALRGTLGDQHFALDADDFLAKVPPSLSSFARNRIAAPVHQDITTARSVLFANAEKLKSRSLTRDNRHGAEEMARAEAMGDEDGATALLREAQERARKKRGIQLFGLHVPGQQQSKNRKRRGWRFGRTSPVRVAVGRGRGRMRLPRARLRPKVRRPRALTRRSPATATRNPPKSKARRSKT